MHQYYKHGIGLVLRLTRAKMEKYVIVLLDCFTFASFSYELATCPMVTMRYCATSSRRVCSENAIKGFAGKWTFFRADSANDSSISSQFRCLRTYDLVCESKISL